MLGSNPIDIVQFMLCDNGRMGHEPTAQLVLVYYTISVLQRTDQQLLSQPFQ